MPLIQINGRDIVLIHLDVVQRDPIELTFPSDDHFNFNFDSLHSYFRMIHSADLKCTVAI